jgi:hypothetical protein
VGEWTFVQVEDHGFTGELADKPLYGFVVGEPEISGLGGIKFGELYPSLEHAMVAAVAEKFTGPRGAGGSGVGTAADWFMRMIGADQLHAAGDVGSVALTSALVGQGVSADRWTVRRIEKGLESRGVVLAHTVRTGTS